MSSNPLNAWVCKLVEWDAPGGTLVGRVLAVASETALLVIPEHKPPRDWAVVPAVLLREVEQEDRCPHCGQTTGGKP